MSELLARSWNYGDGVRLEYGGNRVCVSKATPRMVRIAARELVYLAAGFSEDDAYLAACEAMGWDAP